MYKRGVKKCGDDYMLHILKCFLLWNITQNIFWVKVMRHLIIGNILKDRHLFTYHTKMSVFLWMFYFKSLIFLLQEKVDRINKIWSLERNMIFNFYFSFVHVVILAWARLTQNIYLRMVFTTTFLFAFLQTSVRGSYGVRTRWQANN